MKATSLLVLRTVILVMTLPAGVLLVTLIFHPNQDAALGLIPVLLLTVTGLAMVGVVINHHWLQVKPPEPRWPRPWYVRLSIRLIVVALLFAILILANPTF